MDGSAGDGQGVLRSSGAKKFVKDGEASPGLAGLEQDTLEIHHLRHEMAIAVDDIVVEVDRNGDHVKPRQFAFLRWYGQAEMGERHAKADCLKQGGFAGHVGA